MVVNKALMADLDDRFLGMVPEGTIADLKTPGAKADTGKLRYDLLPPAAVRELVRVLTYGAEKYSPNGWQQVPDAKARYTAALMRHFEALRAGEFFDPESGLPHLAHVLCNAVFLFEIALGNSKGKP